MYVLPNLAHLSPVLTMLTPLGWAEPIYHG